MENLQYVLQLMMVVMGALSTLMGMRGDTWNHERQRPTRNGWMFILFCLITLSAGIGDKLMQMHVDEQKNIADTESKVKLQEDLNGIIMNNKELTQAQKQQMLKDTHKMLDAFSGGMGGIQEFLVKNQHSIETGNHDIAEVKTRMGDLAPKIETIQGSTDKIAALQTQLDTLEANSKQLAEIRQFEETQLKVLQQKASAQEDDLANKANALQALTAKVNATDKNNAELKAKLDAILLEIQRLRQAPPAAAPLTSNVTNTP